MPGEPGIKGQKGENAIISKDQLTIEKGEPGPKGSQGR